MKVQMVDVIKVKPYPKNPRINDAAIVEVIKSIKQFGFQQPIVVNKKNIIIVGHTRFAAAKEMKLKKVPVLIASELTPKQVKAYRIADNKTNEFAKWDLDLLKDELLGLDKMFTGFSEAEMDSMFFGFDTDDDSSDDSTNTNSTDDDLEENEVKLVFLMSVEDRDKIVIKLNKLKAKKAFETLSEALCSLLLK